MCNKQEAYLKNRDVNVHMNIIAKNSETPVIIAHIRTTKIVQYSEGLLGLFFGFIFPQELLSKAAVCTVFIMIMSDALLCVYLTRCMS
jgi:hypothetical protein